MAIVVTDEAYTSYIEASVFENVTDIVIGDGGGGFSRSLDIQGLVLGASVVVLIIVPNLLSLAAFIVERRLRTYNNYFIINLVLADLLVGVSQTVGVAHTLLRYFPFSQGFCKVYLGIRQGLFFVSIVGMVVICIDRHRATYDPINHFISRSKRKAVIMNILTWVLALGFWFGYSTAWDFIVNIDSGKHCFAAYVRYAVPNLIQNIITFFVPLAITSVLYIRIYIKIKATIGGKGVTEKFKETKNGRSNMAAESRGEISLESSSISTAMETVSEDINNVTDTPTEAIKDKREPHKTGHKGGANRESHKEMMKANRTLSCIIISFIVAWLPNSIIYLLYAIDPALIQGMTFPPEVRQFFIWLRYCNSFFNPICYAASQPLFRRTVRDLFLQPQRFCGK